MDIAKKNFLVAGLGRSGIAAARFLKARGAAVTVTDASEPDNLGRFYDMALKAGVKLELGGNFYNAFDKADHIIISPGVPHTIEPIQKAIAKKIPVTGEIELASRFIEEPIVAITGTNGKTTVTTLVGQMLEKSGKSVYVGGNIGKPLIEYADMKQKRDIVVAEISSFQLDTIKTFKPKTGVILNISEDHLDRYPDFGAYAKSKWRIFKNQDENDFAVLNGSDSHTSEVPGFVKARKLLFGDGKNLAEAASIKDGKITFSKKMRECSDLFGKEKIYLQKTKLEGRHNHENIAASCLAVAASGGNMAGMISALKEFRGLPHRIEHIASINGVDYYNDSKATNTDATLKALQSFDRPVILIMGGMEKKSDFNLMKDGVSQKAKRLIVIGEAGKKIASVFKEILPVKPAGSMEEAVHLASKASTQNDAVLLSPACASFDMYENYAERGKSFVSAVDEIKNKKTKRKKDVANRG